LVAIGAATVAAAGEATAATGASAWVGIGGIIFVMVIGCGAFAAAAATGAPAIAAAAATGAPTIAAVFDLTALVLSPFAMRLAVPLPIASAAAPPRIEEMMGFSCTSVFALARLGFVASAALFFPKFESADGILSAAVAAPAGFELTAPTTIGAATSAVTFVPVLKPETAEPIAERAALLVGTAMTAAAVSGLFASAPASLFVLWIGPALGTRPSVTVEAMFCNTLASTATTFFSLALMSLRKPMCAKKE